jgi:hypothetical protein
MTDTQSMEDATAVLPLATPPAAPQQQQPPEAEDACALLRQGVRLLAAQLRQADLGVREGTDGRPQGLTNPTSQDKGMPPLPATADGSSVTATTNLDLLLPQLSAGHTADLLVLQNAAHMLQAHAVWASQEAAWAVQDLAASHAATCEWQQRALAAELKLAQVEASQGHLTARHERCKQERRLLIREVRKLRSPVTQPTADDGSLWTQCETYVLGALRLHEAQLKGGGSPTSSNHKDHHTNATVDDCLSLCTTFDDEDRMESPPQVTNPSFSLPASLAAGAAASPTSPVESPPVSPGSHVSGVKPRRLFPTRGVGMALLDSYQSLRPRLRSASSLSPTTTKTTVASPHSASSTTPSTLAIPPIAVEDSSLQDDKSSAFVDRSSDTDDDDKEFSGCAALLCHAAN